MKTIGQQRIILLLLLALTLGTAAPAGAQLPTGSIELVVRATPTGGKPEKVMKQPIYLLRASLRSIEEEARREITPPDRAAFIESLEVSPELKAWMKRTGRFALRGEEFTRSLTPDDIMGVPEFFLAYQERNLPFVSFGFPKRKAKPKDRTQNPKKWAESEKRYLEEVRGYLELHPETKQGLDEHLTHIDAAARWQMVEHQHEARFRQYTVQLVESRYRVARTETDYEGRARFDNIPPGHYWLSNLWHEVRAGDLHLNWDLFVEVVPGDTLYLELSNANALLPALKP